MRPIVIVEAPGDERSGMGIPLPITGKKARQVSALVGASMDVIREKVDLVPLLSRAPETWDYPLARHEAQRMAPLLRDRFVAMVGRRVAAAFRVPRGTPYFEDFNYFDPRWDWKILCRAVVLPNPWAGRARPWFQGDRREVGRKFLWDLMTGRLGLEEERDKFRAIADHLVGAHLEPGCVNCEAAARTLEEVLSGTV